MFSKTNKILFLGIALVFLFLPSLVSADDYMCCVATQEYLLGEYKGEAFDCDFLPPATLAAGTAQCNGRSTKTFETIDSIRVIAKWRVEKCSIYSGCDAATPPPAEGSPFCCVEKNDNGTIDSCEFVSDYAVETGEGLSCSDDDEAIVSCSLHPECNDKDPIYCEVIEHKTQKAVTCWEESDEDFTTCEQIKYKGWCVKQADFVTGYLASNSFGVKGYTDYEPCNRGWPGYFLLEPSGNEISKTDPLCQVRSDFYEEDSIIWPPAQLEVVVGDIKTVELDLELKTGFSDLEVICQNCANGQSIKLNGNKLTLILDSSLYISAVGSTPPISGSFNIQSTAKDSNNITRISNKQYVFSISRIDCSSYNSSKDDCSIKHKAFCFWYEDGKCMTRDDAFICSQIKKETYCGPNGARFCTWQDGSCLNAVQIDAAGKHPAPEGWEEGLLPKCAYKGTCRNVNDLLELIIRFGKFMLGGIGILAFTFFVYGGFTWIVSFGNANMVKKGRDTMLAAVIGMVIALASYTAVDFILDLLQVSQDFRF